MNPRGLGGAADATFLTPGRTHENRRMGRPPLVPSNSTVQPPVVFSLRIPILKVDADSAPPMKKGSSTSNDASNEGTCDVQLD